MTNQEKATNVLAIIIDELNLPKGATIGDVMLALSAIDPDNEIISILRPLIRNAVIDDIKRQIAS